LSKQNPKTKYQGRRVKWRTKGNGKPHVKKGAEKIKKNLGRGSA